MHLDPTAPFVLLDDARDDGAPARLYTAPVRTLRVDRIADMAPALDALRAARTQGLHAAGYLAYEAAPAFEPRLPHRLATGAPLLWFGLFDRFEEIARGDVPALLPDPAGCWIGEPEPDIDRAAYEERLTRVLALIEAGDIYQANLTFRGIARFAGNPLALYAQLRPQARAGYGGIVSTGAELLLSFPPELFFALQDGALAARPMKGHGAARRDRGTGYGTRADALRSDPKTARRESDDR